jgi:hypothetical protein
MGELSGQLVVKAVEVQARDMEREKELDARLIPGIPSSLQYLYLLNAALGSFAWPVSRSWWARVWPPEQRAGYSGWIGYAAAVVARNLAFVLLFLPLVGNFAFLWHIAVQLWNLMTAPLRFFSWLRSRMLPRTT